MENKEHLLEPHPSSISRSLRDIGYSLETAISDLIDNSITAKARNVWLDVKADSGVALISLRDDGLGMTRKSLIEAMRPGSTNSSDYRESGDLGRFGLGLKTASFSQCKVLTVVTVEDGVPSTARWDLEHVEKQNQWLLQIPELFEDIVSEHINLIGKSGTSIIWQNMDRVLEHTGEAGLISKDELYLKLEVVEEHISLVFHRFLSGESGISKLNIFVNNRKIKPFDPFCKSNSATQILRKEVVRVENSLVAIQPFILPHHSKLSQREYDFYEDRNDFMNNQGIYVYRERRLMIWGSWFRLAKKSEATKLARIQVDFSNELDKYWSIDVKKSRAYPPVEIRNKLKDILQRITFQSGEVHRQRGTKLYSEKQLPIWDRFQNSLGIQYKINREHPLVTTFLKRIDCNRNLADQHLAFIESELPIDAIYSDYSVTPHHFFNSESLELSELKERVNGFLEMSQELDLTQEQLRICILSVRPFSEQIEQTNSVLDEIFNGK